MFFVVDDFAIYAKSANIASIERRLQLTVNRIHTWTLHHGFKISTQKTAAIQFHRGRGLQHEPTIHFNNAPIKFEEKYKFLGLIFDQRLRWQHHIDYLKIECIKSLNIIKTLAHTNWGADRTSLLRLYRSLIRSKLDYGCQIYSSASPNILAKLNPVHNMGIRLCTGAFKSSPIVSLYAESSEPSLEVRRNQIGLQHYIRLMQLPQSVAYTSVHNNPITHVYENNQNISAPMGIRMSRLLTTLHLPDLRILAHEWPQESLWRLYDTEFCKELTKQKKNEIGEEQFKQLFLDHQNQEHTDSVMLYTDGSKTDTGSGCACVCGNFVKRRKLPTHITIFHAELIGILDALEFINNSNSRRYTIFSDSTSALYAIEQYNSSNPIVLKIQNWIVRLHSRHKEVMFCWTPSHINITGNERADHEAGLAATSDDEITFTHIPFRDYYCLIRKSLRIKWQEQWDQVTFNKLRTVKDNVKLWPSSSVPNRKYEVILTRLRIGHTLLTHGHLMEGRPRSFCDDCLVPLTIEHILVECPSYQEERARLVGPAMIRRNITIKDFLAEPQVGSFNITGLMTFLRNTNLFNKI